MAAPSAQDFCKQVQQKKNLIGDITKLAVSTSPIGLIGKALDKLGSHNTSMDIIRNNITSVVGTQTVNETEQACANQAAIAQSNLADNTECIKLLNCGNTVAIAQGLKAAGLTDVQISHQLDLTQANCSALLSGKITQSNTLSAEQNCALDGALDLLNKAALDTNLMAVFQKVQEAKGLMSSNENNTNACNVVSTTVNSSVYSKAYQHCANQLNLAQSNISKCVSSTDQANNATMTQTCMAKQGVQSSTDTAVAVTSNTQLTTKSASSGLTTDMFIAIALIGALALCGMYMLRR